MNPDLSIVCDDPKYEAGCEALYARNFGPGRHAKAAARLREGNFCRHDLSMVALSGDDVVGACRLWPVIAQNGVRALFLGPIAVDVAHRSSGLGRRLVKACLDQVDMNNPHCVILVGDLSFFGRLGFEVVPDGQVLMPGPVDTKRLLWRASQQQGAAPQGNLRAASASLSPPA